MVKQQSLGTMRLSDVEISTSGRPFVSTMEDAIMQMPPNYTILCYKVGSSFIFCVSLVFASARLLPRRLLFCDWAAVVAGREQCPSVHPSSTHRILGATFHPRPRHAIRLIVVRVRGGRCVVGRRSSAPPLPQRTGRTGHGGIRGAPATLGNLVRQTQERGLSAHIQTFA
jgi:hypothetical protein